MDWTLANIRTKLRNLTGRLDENVVTDATLDDEINAYYQYQFPDEVDLIEFFGFTTFNTVAGTETYNLPATTGSVELPVTIEDSDGNVSQLDLYTEPALFKDEYPDDAHNETAERDQPTAMLIYGRVCYLRPVPDAIYTVEYAGLSTQPTALSGDSATLDDGKWGPTLAYGAAIEYLQASGQNEAADDLKDLYAYYKALIARKQLRQIPSGSRAQPRF